MPKQGVKDEKNELDQLLDEISESVNKANEAFKYISDEAKNARENAENALKFATEEGKYSEVSLMKSCKLDDMINSVRECSNNISKSYSNCEKQVDIVKEYAKKVIEKAKIAIDSVENTKIKIIRALAMADINKKSAEEAVKEAEKTPKILKDRVSLQKSRRFGRGRKIRGIMVSSRARRDAENGKIEHLRRISIAVSNSSSNKYDYFFCTGEMTSIINEWNAHLAKLKNGDKDWKIPTYAEAIRLKYDPGTTVGKKVDRYINGDSSELDDKEQIEQLNKSLAHISKEMGNMNFLEYTSKSSGWDKNQVFLKIVEKLLKFGMKENVKALESITKGTVFSKILSCCEFPRPQFMSTM